MRNLYEEMALFSIKIERIKYNAVAKLSALQDELKADQEKDVRKAAKRAMARSMRNQGLSAMSQAAIRQYDFMQREGIMNAYGRQQVMSVSCGTADHGGVYFGEDVTFEGCRVDPVQMLNPAEAKALGL